MERCSDDTLVQVLYKGGVAVVPSDTLYGVMAKADSPEAFARIYDVKGRDRTKRCVVLLADPAQVDDLGLHVPLWAQIMLERAWPGPLSVELKATSVTPQHLLCGFDAMAVRVPDDDDLRCLIRKTGPLVAPSANPEGMPPATTIYWAKEYFGDNVDYYFDGGCRSGDASTYVSIGEESYSVIREGAFDVSMLSEYKPRV